MTKASNHIAGIGLRAKTGRTIAVLLAGPADAPRVIKRVDLSLVDPAVPATCQPYHEVMDLPWEKARVTVRKFASRIEKIAARQLASLLKEAKAEGLQVRGIGIVGAGERNLEKIGSTHIRAHAAEGVLFRAVLEVAARENKIQSRSFDEKCLDETVGSELEFSDQVVKARLAEMGREAGSPWRADEKAAATAAWLMLKAKH